VSAARKAIEAEPAARAPQVRAAVDRSPAATIQAVQRTAGNRAVLALLRRRAAPSRRVLARRRVPSQAELEKILFDPSGAGHVDAADAAEHRKGLERLIALSREEMSAAEQAKVDTERQKGLNAAQWAALPASEKDVREAQAIVKLHPDALLGDPAQINTGPRPGTKDAAHITKLVNGANEIFDRIATGAVDGHIKQVFGAAHVAEAKARYANARTKLNALHTSGDIVTDRSGYNAEAFVGGLTNDSRIGLAPGNIDNPTHRESIITCIHESMHAGNYGVVGDDGPYIDRGEEFVRADEAVKLATAAHYEVVPRRMLGMGKKGNAFPGRTFVPGVLAPAAPPAPAPAPAPPVAPPAPAPPAPAGPVVSLKEQAAGAAYLRWKEAWTTALNLHDLWVRNNLTPGDWTKDIQADFAPPLPGPAKFTDVLPFWSKVEGLTIHNRAHINPASADPSTQPVTQIDIALSEAVVRKLARGMFAAPQTEAAAIALEATATAAEVAAATTVEKERDLLIKLVAHQIGTVTGNEVRDVFVVNELGPKNLSFPEMLVKRGPGAFAH
jgi:hypothetical protein